MIFQNFVRAFLKAAGHRYIKRIPYMTPRGRRYRYIYRVSSTHQGRHAFDPEHLVEGTKFALHGEGESEFHGHITKVDGDQVTYVIDDGPRKGEEVTTSRKELVAELNRVHGVQDKLTAEREKVRGAIAEAKRAGHTGVVRRLERRLRALGGEPEAQPAEPAESAVPKQATQMLAELERIKEIAKQGPSGKYRRLSASAGDYSSRNFPDLDSPAKLYQAIRDNIKNVSAEGDYTHAMDQISTFLSSGALQSEQGYMLRRLLREMNPLDQSPEELRREEAEDERINRDTSDTLAAFHDLEAQPTEPEPEAQPAEPTESVEPEAESVEPEAESSAPRFREIIDSSQLSPDADRAAFGRGQFSALRKLQQGKELTPANKKALKAFVDMELRRMVASVFSQLDADAGASYLAEYERDDNAKYNRLSDFARHAGLPFQQYDNAVARANRSVDYAKRVAVSSNEEIAFGHIMRQLDLNKQSTRGELRDQVANILADYADTRVARMEEEQREAARNAIHKHEIARARRANNPLTSTQELMDVTAEIERRASELPEDERKEIEERSKQFFEQRERKAQERAERRERERQERLEQQERERQEARARRLEEAEGDRFIETVTPEQAREDYHDAQVKGDLEALRNRRDELEGVDPVAITKAVKEPIPTDGTERVYTLPDGGRLAAHIDGDTLVYQYQFPAGTVSNKQEAKLNTKRKMTDARLRKLAQGLAAAYYGGDGAYYTPETEEAIEDHRADIADVARLNKAERAFSTFDERTRETRVQQDALDPITPRSDAINSAEDIDKKTLSALKRTRSTDKIRTNMTQAGRAGDLLFATDGRRLFYRRGMNYGTDNKVVAIDNKATPEQLDQRPPGADVLVDRVEGNTQHAGTMSKETAKHLADALEIAKGTGADSALFVRADGEKVAIIYKGRELASFPQAEGSESRGDYGVSADYFRDALLDGGSVSLYLHPENPRVDVEPMRLESMAGAHIIMPQRF